MKILYVGSNPRDEYTLLLEREITELQARFSNSSNSSVSFTFLPGLSIEELPREISRVKPDILHISSHGREAGLWLAGQDTKGRKVTAEALREFVSIEPRPRLVILSACNSGAIAERMMAAVPMAIGISAEITNVAARESIRLFYERLLAGQSVGKAFGACSQMIGTIESGSASARLFQAKGIHPDQEFFFISPRIIARFKSKKFKRNRDGEFEIGIGIIGCPGNTYQLVFFTDDEYFVDEEDDDLEQNLCLVTRSTVVRGEFWANGAWLAAGDHRIFACGVTADGEYFTTASLLSEAIVYFHRVNMRDYDAAVPTRMSTAIEDLKSRDGSELGRVRASVRERNLAARGPAGTGAKMVSRS
jgi:hypothetical protein